MNKVSQLEKDNRDQTAHSCRLKDCIKERRKGNIGCRSQGLLPLVNCGLYRPKAVCDVCGFLCCQRSTRRYVVLASGLEIRGNSFYRSVFAEQDDQRVRLIGTLNPACSQVDAESHAVVRKDAPTDALSGLKENDGPVGWQPRGSSQSRCSGSDDTSRKVRLGRCSCNEGRKREKSQDKSHGFRHAFSRLQLPLRVFRWPPRLCCNLLRLLVATIREMHARTVLLGIRFR
jgi:hypothetical protein